MSHRKRHSFDAKKKKNIKLSQLKITNEFTHTVKKENAHSKHV